VEAFDVLAAPRRREILRLLWREERSAGAIHRAMPEVSFGAVSQHLRRLEAAGLVQLRREGRFRYYRALPERAGDLRGWLESHWDDALARLRVQAEMEQARRGPRPGTRPRRGRRGRKP
jgi:DNA-binding transcriptional ArsR family regulator